LNEILNIKKFTAIFNGLVAEQFAGQEFLTYKNPYTKAKTYYWTRETKSSNTELDYSRFAGSKHLKKDFKKKQPQNQLA